MTSSIDTAFAHMGLYVTECAPMERFYCSLLGFVVTDRGQIGESEFVFLSRDPNEHHQIVLASGRTPGTVSTVQQISFRTHDLTSLKVFHQRLAAEGAKSIVPLSHGNAWSVYFADPDGNRLEVYTETPWHVAQPLREPLDLTRPEAEIIAATEALCRARPGFRPRAEWRREMAQRMGRDRGDPEHGRG
jgi:catechol 2,3-dioxygenase